MKLRAALILVLVNVLLTVLMLAVYAEWFEPRSPKLATLDVADLYRRKEAQVTTVLTQHDASDAERSAALKHAQRFGLELSQLLQALSQDCACLILVRGAVASPSTPASSTLPDLTPAVRRQLGL